MLTENLKQMEDDGLIKREVFAEIPLRVEYSLTSLGLKMKPIIYALAEFGNVYKKQYKNSKQD